MLEFLRRWLLKERTFAKFAGIPDCAEDDVACRERLRKFFIRAVAFRVHHERKAGRCIISGPIFLKVRRPDGKVDLYCEIITGWFGKRLDVVDRLIDRGFEPLEPDWDAARDFAEFITDLAMGKREEDVTRQEVAGGVQGDHQRLK